MSEVRMPLWGQLRTAVEYDAEGLFGLSARLSDARSADDVFSALESFLQDAARCKVSCEMSNGKGSPMRRWSNLRPEQIEASDRAGIAGSLSSVLQDSPYPAALRWTASEQANSYCLPDPANCALLKRNGVAGGLFALMRFDDDCLATVSAIASLEDIRELAELSVQTFLSAAMQTLTGMVAKKRSATWQSLTRREAEALRFTAEGLRAYEVAARMGVSEATVKYHLSGVREKLDARTTREAIYRSLQMNS